MNNGLKGDPTNEQQNYPGIAHLLPTVETYVGTAAIPSAGAIATMSHGLRGVPQSVRVVLQCTDAGGDNGWAQNEEIDISSVRSQYSNSNDVREPMIFVVYSDETSINCLRGNLAPMLVFRKSDGEWTTGLTLAKWQLKAYATYLAPATTTPT